MASIVLNKTRLLQTQHQKQMTQIYVIIRSNSVTAAETALPGLDILK